MANVIKTVMTFPLTGQVDFPITFEYLARKFVRITLIGKDRKVLTLNSDYRFSTKTQITTNKAWTAADGYEYIEIRRFTSAAERLVDFADGSILRAYDLNIAQIQAIHIAEEARDLTADTIGINNDGDLDARGRRIVNVADPQSDFDAINLHIVKVWNESALSSANRATSEADRAAREADRASNEANRSSSSADASLSSATKSEDAANRSLQDANRSQAQAQQGKTYMENAEKSSQSASQSSSTASKKATEATNSATRSKNEADRAAREASKLGNWNALADAVQEVKPPATNFTGEVHWKYTLVNKIIDIGNKLNIGWRNTDKSVNPYLEFHHDQSTWCGNFTTTPEGYLSFNGNSLSINCDTTIGNTYSNSLTTAGGIYNNGGEIQNRAGSYYISTKQVKSTDSTNNVPSAAMHWKPGDDQQSAYTFLECGGSDLVSYSFFVKDITRNMDASYKFRTDMFCSNKNIRVDNGGRHANFQWNGDITTANGIWQGGSLSNHLNVINNRTIIGMQLGGRQTVYVNKMYPTVDLGNGRVMTGIQFSTGRDSNVLQPIRVYFREVIVQKGDGSWYVIKSL